jgi:signal transduction histidine kinase
MKFIHSVKINAVAACSIVLCATATAFGENNSSPVSNPAHLRILNEYKNKADAYCAKNLNRFGLEELRKYDVALDSIVANEKQDTLAAIQKSYALHNSRRQAMTDSLTVQSAELSATKETSTVKYHSLLRKAGITFAIWLIAVLLLLRIRNRSVKKSQLSLEANKEQLRTSEASFSNGEELFRSGAEWKVKSSDMKFALLEMQKNIQSAAEKLPAEIVQGETFKSLQKNSLAVQANIHQLENISSVISLQHGEVNQEKQPTNINQLCEQYVEFAYAEMQAEDGTFICQLTKDFEKNLPLIKINPEAVGKLLLNILSNAFNSVREKQQSQIKGYVPKVSVSTRILPRFVQIRVKDNGNGIPDEELELIYEPFYSTQPIGSGAGLGLFFSKEIIEQNKGEIKIESDYGNSTDVYLKFFLQH